LALISGDSACTWLSAREKQRGQSSAWLLRRRMI
jgi:hypothetical protein